MSAKKTSSGASTFVQPQPIVNKLEAPLLIWYDTNNDDRGQSNKFIFFTNAQQCIEMLKQSTRAIFLILNSSSATDILSHVQSLIQVDTIFIHCPSTREQQRYQHLLKDYPKIFDLFVNREQLLNVIEENVILYELQSGNEYLRYGQRYKQRNEFHLALKYTHKALETYGNTLNDSIHPLIARCLNHLGGIYDAQGDSNRAMDYYTQAIRMYSQLSPEMMNSSVSRISKKK